jgi:four-jointed box protein 1
MNSNEKTICIDSTTNLSSMLTLRKTKRRGFHSQTCMFSVMAAFTIGLAMGIFFLPLIGLTSAKSPSLTSKNNNNSNALHFTGSLRAANSNDSMYSTNNDDDNAGQVVVVGKVFKYDFKSSIAANSKNSKKHNKNQIHARKTQPDIARNANSFTPTTINNNFLNPTIYSSVSFISDEKYSTENILNTLNNGKLARKVNNDYRVEVDDAAIEIPDDGVNDDNNNNDDYEMKMEREFTSYNSRRRHPASLLNIDEKVKVSSSSSSTLQRNNDNNNNNDFVESNIDDDDDLEQHDKIGVKLQQSRLYSNYNRRREDDENEDDSLHEKEDDSYEMENNETLRRIVDDDIYWGQVIELQQPIGFNKRDTEDWRNYLESNTTEIIRIEAGCGRMQNRLVTFSDGVKACVRYRQNTDQIQGELFSFYLGRLLNISNLAPSTAAVIDWDAKLWSQVKDHIIESQWKSARPIVLTKWIPELEPSGIPVPFRPLERHLNKEDIRNMTIFDDDENAMKSTQILIDRLKPKKHKSNFDIDQSSKHFWQRKKIILSDRMIEKFVELAQWSDLIVFDYLIANLDRVVNNLYNFQWNADIMAAPAHNLARQINSQLLVFLDNESGLLHGYRLLKKYEAYHGLLLDNLCMFRKSTIDALKTLRFSDPGRLLNESFEHTTSSKVRDVLPPLPEKSTKILLDRIDRVLQQVEKCKEIFSNR